jgi:uncharacterized protein YcnI
MNLYRTRIALLGAMISFSMGAAGHSVVDEPTVTAGSQFITVRITHGCGNSPTHTVRVQMPAGVTRVYPFYVPGWTVKTNIRKLDPPLEGEYGMVTETIDQIEWTGEPIANGLFAEFKFKATIPAEIGRTLYFKTIQLCDNGESERFIDVPKPGEKDFSHGGGYDNPIPYENPAPFTKIVAGPPARPYGN